MRQGYVFTGVRNSVHRVGGMRGRGGGMHGRGACMAGGHAWQGACMAGGIIWQCWGHVWQGAGIAGGPAWWEACMVGGHVWQGACMARGCARRGVDSRGCGDVGGVGGVWGACMARGCMAGGMCGRGRVCVEGVCMVGACMAGGVSGIGACVAGETATAAGWYASYWNAFLFCRKLQENETIWTLRGIRVPDTPLDPPMLDVVGPVLGDSLWPAIDQW